MLWIAPGLIVAMPSTSVCLNASKLQVILNAAANRDIAVLAHIASFIRNSVHWLRIRQRIQIKVCNCLTRAGPHYLNVYCTPISSWPNRSSLRSLTWQSLGCGLEWLSPYVFLYYELYNWDNLPQSLRDLYPCCLNNSANTWKLPLYHWPW